MISNFESVRIWFIMLVVFGTLFIVHIAWTWWIERKIQKQTQQQSAHVLTHVANFIYSTVNAFTNIFFIVRITISMLIVIVFISARALYTRHGFIKNIKSVRDDMTQAKFGEMLYT